MTTNDLEPVYDQLKAIIRKYDRDMLVAKETEDGYVLMAPPVNSKGRETQLAAVHMKKDHVSYHLMALYDPDLLGEVSPELLMRLQGKACFNFREVDKVLFREVASLTGKAYRRYIREKWLADRDA